MDQRSTNAERPGQASGRLSGIAQALVVGRIRAVGKDRAELDFGEGRIPLLTGDQYTGPPLEGIGAESLVAVGGRLKPHQWRTGDGKEHHALHLLADRLEMVYDASIGRLLV